MKVRKQDMLDHFSFLSDSPETPDILPVEVPLREGGNCLRAMVAATCAIRKELG